MKLRIEGNNQEIEQVKAILELGFRGTNQKIKSISNFYPNRGAEFVSVPSNVTGRVYLEVE